jgi:hypothetical protein
VPGIQGETVSYQFIKPDSKVIATLVPLIEATPGIESRTLAAVSGLSLSHVKNGLAVISRHKIAGYVELGAKRRGWFMQPEADRRNADFIPVKTRQKMLAAQRPPTARERIMQTARNDIDGVSVSKLAMMLDISEKDAGRHCFQMVKQGRLWISRRAGCLARWFESEERAQCWATFPAAETTELRRKPGRPPSVNKAPKPPKLVAIGAKIKSSTRQPSKAPPLLKGSDRRNQAIKAKPANDATVTLRGKPSDMRGPVDYSRAKITICPAPVSIYRHQYDPGSDAHRAYVRQIEQLRGAA